jgi:predicted enzyme related to lactoylglutathione lyase
MPSTIRPIIVTHDIERLAAFYTALLRAEHTMRYPEAGPAFYIGLQVGNSEIGLSSAAEVRPGDPGRILLSIDVPDVGAVLPRVTELGGTADSAANDMPWGQRVAHIKDPDGNLINLTQELPATETATVPSR